MFNARIDVDVQTLNDFDVLDGGAGTDTLNATLNDDAAPTIENIETFNLRAFAVVTVDFSDVEGATQIWSDNSQDNLVVIDIQEAATFGVRGGGGANDYDVTYDDDVLEDDDYTQNIVLDGADMGALEINTAGDDGITTVSITLTDENILTSLAVVNVAAVDWDTLVLSGAGDLEIDTVLDVDVTTIDGSDSTGDISIAIDGTLLVAGAEIEIDLGAGENTLRLEGIATDVEIGTLVFTDDDLSVAGVSILSFVDAIVLGEDDSATIDLDGVAPSEIVFEGAVTVDSELAAVSLALDNTAAALSITFAGALDDAALTAVGGTFDFGDAAETVTITAEAAIGATNTITFAGAALETLTLTLEDDADFDIVAADADALTSLTVAAEGDASTVTTTITGLDDADDDAMTSLILTDASDAADVTVDVTLVDTTNLATIDATVGDAGDFDIDASDAAFDGAVTINVEFLVDADGDTAGTFDYIAEDGTNAIRETFVFTGDNVGDVTITDFVIGVAGNHDRIDLSAFGISDLSDLAVATIAGNAEITALNGEFDGTITLVGVDAADLTNTNFLV